MKIQSHVLFDELQRGTDLFNYIRPANHELQKVLQPTTDRTECTLENGKT
jgi:hypothetical protein